MNVGQLRKAIADLPDDMPVTAYTTGDTEFTVAVATLYQRVPVISPRLMLGNDPGEVDHRHEKLLHVDKED